MKRWIMISAATLCVGLVACGTGDTATMTETGISTAKTETTVSQSGTIISSLTETSAAVQGSTAETETALSSESTQTTVTTMQTTEFTEETFTTLFVQPVSRNIPGTHLTGVWKLMHETKTATLSVRQNASYEYTDESGTHSGTVTLDKELADAEGTSYVQYFYTFHDADGTTWQAYTRTADPEFDFYLYQDGTVLYAREVAADLINSVAGEWVELSTNNGIRNILTIKKDGTYRTDGANGKKDIDFGTLRLERIMYDDLIDSDSYWAEFLTPDENYYGSINGKPPIHMCFLGRGGGSKFIKKQDADLMADLAGEWTEQGGNNLVLSVAADGSFSTKLNGEQINGRYEIEEKTLSDDTIKKEFVFYHMAEPFLQFTVPDENSFRDLYSEKDKSIHYVRTGTPFRKTQK